MSKCRWAQISFSLVRVWCHQDLHLLFCCNHHFLELSNSTSFRFHLPCRIPQSFVNLIEQSYSRVKSRHQYPYCQFYPQTVRCSWTHQFPWTRVSSKRFYLRNCSFPKPWNYLPNQKSSNYYY